MGDGSRINIQHDNWIPKSGSLRPLVVKSIPNITRVFDLFNDHGTGWDELKLGQVFSDSDIADYGGLPSLELYS